MEVSAIAAVENIAVTMSNQPRLDICWLKPFPTDRNSCFATYVHDLPRPVMIVVEERWTPATCTHANEREKTDS